MHKIKIVGSASEGLLTPEDPAMGDEPGDDTLIEDMAHGPYEFKALEDDIIKYICQKIVAMREQPFIDAVENLKRAQELNNLQMIMDMQRNKQKLNANLEKHTATVGTAAAATPGPGMSASHAGSVPNGNKSFQGMLKSQYSHAQDFHSVTEDKMMGNATFKAPPTASGTS